MPSDPPKMSCYAAELPSATVHVTLLIPYWPYHPSDASYGPVLCRVEPTVAFYEKAHMANIIYFRRYV